MIVRGEGNLLEAHADALVNTVNTVGVMGKGIALQFKRAYPAMFEDYARAAKAGELATGRMHVWATDAAYGPRYVINFPTKQHWKGRSKLEFISEGLHDLSRVVDELSIESIALPPLGCGNGGLPWGAVRPLIEETFAASPVKVILFEPIGAPAASRMPDRRPRTTLTPGRALLLRSMVRYRNVAMEDPSHLELQKLLYFVQEAGEPLRLRFVKGGTAPTPTTSAMCSSSWKGTISTGTGTAPTPSPSSGPSASAQRLRLPSFSPKRASGSIGPWHCVGVSRPRSAWSCWRAPIGWQHTRALRGLTSAEPRCGAGIPGSGSCSRPTRWSRLGMPSGTRAGSTAQNWPRRDTSHPSPTPTKWPNTSEIPLAAPADPGAGARVGRERGRRCQARRLTDKCCHFDTFELLVVSVASRRTFSAICWRLTSPNLSRRHADCSLNNGDGQ